MWKRPYKKYCNWQSHAYVCISYKARTLLYYDIMTSSNENILRVTGICAGNSPVTGDSPHKGQWRWILIFSLICASINVWVNKHEAGDLRRHRTRYDVIVMIMFIGHTTFPNYSSSLFIKYLLQYWTIYCCMVLTSHGNAILECMKQRCDKHSFIEIC